MHFWNSTFFLILEHCVKLFTYSFNWSNFFVCLVFSRVEPVQLAFIILGASMAALALIILVVGFLATGSTRHNVYRTTFGRTGGTVGMHLFPWNQFHEKISSIKFHRLLIFCLAISACCIFIAITYLLLLCWKGVFACCIVMTVFYSLHWGVCNTGEIGWQQGKIDFYPYHFMFPNGK